MEQYVGGVTSRLKTYLQEDRKRLGPQAVRIVESINHCIKAEQLQDLLSHNQELFPTLLSLVRKFPLNNIFHNEVEKLITTSLASTPALVRNVPSSSSRLSKVQIFSTGWRTKPKKNSNAERTRNTPKKDTSDISSWSADAWSSKVRSIQLFLKWSRTRDLALLWKW